MRSHKRGEIYYADLDPVQGSEQGGRRPVLILQNNIGNKHGSTVIIAPITRKKNLNDGMPTHVWLGYVNWLNSNSVLLLEQIRTIDKSRLYRYKGRISSCKSILSFVMLRRFSCITSYKRANR